MTYINVKIVKEILEMNLLLLAIRKIINRLINKEQKTIRNTKNK